MKHVTDAPEAVAAICCMHSPHYHTCPSQEPCRYCGLFSVPSNAASKMLSVCTFHMYWTSC